LDNQKYNSIEKKLNEALCDAGFSNIGFKKNLVIGLHP